jgi:DnaJ family protein A protein 5
LVSFIYKAIKWGAFMENYYEILGVDSTATQEEIQRRYRFLAMAFHPDRVWETTVERSC